MLEAEEERPEQQEEVVVRHVCYADMDTDPDVDMDSGVVLRCRNDEIMCCVTEKCGNMEFVWELGQL